MEFKSLCQPYTKNKDEHEAHSFFKNYKDYLTQTFIELSKENLYPKILFAFKFYLKRIKHILYKKRTLLKRIDVELITDTKLNVSQPVLVLEKENGDVYKMCVFESDRAIAYSLYINDKLFYTVDKSTKNIKFLDMFYIFLSSDKDRLDALNKDYLSLKFSNILKDYDTELLSWKSIILSELIKDLYIHFFIEREPYLFYNILNDFYLYICDLKFENGNWYLIYKYSFNNSFAIPIVISEKIILKAVFMLLNDRSLKRKNTLQNKI